MKLIITISKNLLNSKNLLKYHYLQFFHGREVFVDKILKISIDRILIKIEF